MVLEFCLVGGHVFEPHCMFIFHFIKPKRGCLWFVYLRACVCLYISPCAGMRSHVRKGVRVHDMPCEPKSCKLKLLGKLVVQQLWLERFPKTYAMAYQRQCCNYSNKMLASQPLG